MKSLKRAILATLAYADVFDYSLTEKEIRIWLISVYSLESSVYSKKNISKALLHLLATGRSGLNAGYYFLNGREKIANLRQQREKWSREKLKKAERVAEFLKIVPWVKMVGVTGSLALLNSDKNDDIDILIVSEKNRLWLTRLLVTLLVELLGERRRPPKIDSSLLTNYRTCDNLSTRNKICLNMFLDEDHLMVPKKEQDLYSAHEVAQMRPLWDKDNTYQKFLAANQWVKNYLPNAVKVKSQKDAIAPKANDRYSRRMMGSKVKTSGQNSKVLFSFFILICNFAFCILHFEFLEAFSKRLQLWYMQKRRTTEVISEGIIRFHPKDARGWVLKEYNLRLQKLKLNY